MEPSFKEYQAQILRNARAMAETLVARGHRLVSGGTDTHLMLLNLKDSPLTGKDGESALEHVGITVNKNTVPFETRSPFITSGIRIGTPALTTRGMKEPEMERIGNWIADILASPEDEAVKTRVSAEVRELCGSFPLYAGRLEAYTKV
jgi:glycine hydroxymethyltransferase